MRLASCVVGGLLAAAALAGGSTPSANADAGRADLLMVVDCLLPGQVRQLGNRSTYLSARRPARLTARDCQIRGGEYVAFDRADARSALGAWLPLAEEGDQEARVIVGEIYERGIGLAPDYAAAARWYTAAAEEGSKRAQVNLGHLYERGLGVPADAKIALEWYRRAAGRDAGIQLDAPAPPAPSPDRDAEIAALRSELGRSAAAAEALSQALDAARAANDGRVAAHERELAAARAETDRLGRDLASALALADSRKAEMDRLAAPVAARLLAGPELVILEPALTPTRDIVPVATAAPGPRRLVGRVTAPAGIVSLTVNASVVEANEFGVFTAALPAQESDADVVVSAVDRQGKRSEARFTLRAAAAALAPAAPEVAVHPAVARAEFGAYHALVIGNNDYRTLPDLSSPVNDAAELARLLRDRYGFATTVLLNADRYQILSALNALREKLTPADNLLVYFAGHGELDEVNQRGHWLPVDAERDSTANWIPTTAVTDILNIMRAKQVMLVVDSCYAGALTRSSVARLSPGMTEAERRHWLRTMASRRSRTVLTSGGVAPVMDAGGGKHSVFAKALLDVLAENADVMDGQRLHREVSARVAFAAANLRFDQVPEYAPVRFAGHEGGEFFLVPGT